MVCQLNLIVATIATLAPVAQSVASIWNGCEHSVYIWSVPGGTEEGSTVNAYHAYNEPFYYGGDQNPGVALKISSQPNGIYEGKDELEVQYTVEPKVNPTHVWIKLHVVRAPESGLPYKNGIYFKDCVGSTTTPLIDTRKCPINTLARLELCGQAATNATKHEQKSNHWRRVGDSSGTKHSA